VAPHQDGTKQGRRCSHSTWSLDDSRPLSSGCSQQDLSRKSFLGHLDTWLNELAGIVAIENPERHIRKASLWQQKLHTVAANNNRVHTPQSLLLLDRATYMYGVVLRAHSVRGEPRIQRNASGVVATGSYDSEKWLYIPGFTDFNNLYYPDNGYIASNC